VPQAEEAALDKGVEAEASLQHSRNSKSNKPFPQLPK
jgi:hypothetical protein